MQTSDVSHYTSIAKVGFCRKWHNIAAFICMKLFNDY